MADLREKLVESYRAGTFLQVALDSTHDENQSVESVAALLVDLHNGGTINIIEAFMGLHRSGGPDFFLTRHLFDKALPRLNSPVQNVMDCVAHLVSEAGQDMAANWIFASFIDYCAADQSRPEHGVTLITASPAYLNFITPVIVAGTRVNMTKYFDEAVRLTSNSDIEVRKRAIFSLGRIEYVGNSELPRRAFEALEALIANEFDDNLTGIVIKTICSLCIADSSLTDPGIKLLNQVLSKGGEYTLHAAAEEFGLENRKLPEAIIDCLMQYLIAVNPSNKGTLEMIGFGVHKLMAREDPSKAIAFLESFLLTHDRHVSFKSMDTTVHGILTSNKKLLNKLMTKWFLKGDRALCDAINVLVTTIRGDEVSLEIDPAELPTVDYPRLLFIARKAVGYLFMRSTTTASIIISLIRLTNDAAAVRVLGSLLYDPLLLNYSGTLREYLSAQVEKETGLTKKAIQTALDTFAAYLDGLKSVGEVPEMYASQDHREIYARHWQQNMSETFKEAMKKSIVNLIATKTVVLYGRKSINYIRSSQGQSQRMEIPMTSHGAQIEFPRQDHIDPFGLDYMLRVFRAERWAKT